jgi:hypothetical protein
MVVVMNRDERCDRPTARPPRRWRGGDVGFTAPLDPAGGGSWIAVRDSGLVIALLNHHPPAGSMASAATDRPSRGRLVTALAGERGVPDARRLRAAGLTGFAPFRLFVAGPATPPRVFTWDGRLLRARRLEPALGFLTSSSWNARAVIPVRHARFRAFARDHGGRPTRAALLAFHDATDDPRGTPWAICMTRDDARTVSTTVIDAGRSGVSMRYRRR